MVLTNKLDVMPVQFKTVSKRNPLKQDSKPKFYPAVVTSGEFTLKQLAKRVADMSSFSESDIQGLLPAILKAIPDALADGKIVRLGDLGSLRITVKSEGSDDEKKVSSANIKSTGIIFSPGKDLKAAISNITFEKG
jgi:predicted histone-like DNA-binding protein